MGDKFFHPDGQKAQDIKMRGGRLVRSGVKKTGNNPSVAERMRRRNQMLDDAYKAAGDTEGAGTVDQKRSGVSGYKTPKGQVEEGLDKAGEETEKPEEEG
jgi:hypothetical protein